MKRRSFALSALGAAAAAACVRGPLGARTFAPGQSATVAIVRRRRSRASVPGGCSSHGGKSMHAGYTLDDALYGRFGRR